MTNEPVSSTIYTGASEGSGRISIVTEPALPATCVVCVRSANGSIKFIDFNFSLDYYGAVVICEDCLKESLSLLDFVPSEKLLEVINALTKAVQDLEVANSELDKYRSAFDTLRFIRPDLNPLVLADAEQSEDSEKPVGDSEPTDEGSVETEPSPNGSDSSGGLKDVSIFAD